MMRKIRFILIPLILLGLHCGSIPRSFAQNMQHTVVERRVRFSRGQSKAILRGKANYAMSYVYIVRAGAGQNMELHLKSRDEAVRFSLIPPEETQSMENAFLVSQWSGTLPQTGDYRIIVVMNEKELSKIRYTLEVAID